MNPASGPYGCDTRLPATPSDPGREPSAPTSAAHAGGAEGQQPPPGVDAPTRRPGGSPPAPLAPLPPKAERSHAAAGATAHPAAAFPGDTVPLPVKIAVMLRLVQWHLDDVAHDLPAGRVTSAQRDELAGLLEDVAGFLRAVPLDEPGDVT